MLNALCNIADQICMLVVGVGKAILPGICAPLVDLYGECIYGITGAIRGIGGSSWKGAAVAGAIGFGGLVASGYVGPRDQQPQWLLGTPQAPASTTAPAWTDAPVQTISASLADGRA